MNHSRLFTATTMPMILPESGYIRLPCVLHHIGVSKSTWYEGMKAGIYPKQVRIGRRAVGWNVDEIRACMAAFKTPPQY